MGVATLDEYRQRVHEAFMNDKVPLIFDDECIRTYASHIDE